MFAVLPMIILAPVLRDMRCAVARLCGITTPIKFDDVPYHFPGSSQLAFSSCSETVTKGP
jgi:hypothetical protein